MPYWPFFPLVLRKSRFVINPECLVSILLCEEMDDEESILLVGAEQFSLYLKVMVEASSALAHTRISTPLREEKTVSLWPWIARGKDCVIVAMDATCFMSSGHIIQYNKKNILRELNKDYCGFRHTITILLLHICPRGHWKLGVWHVWGRETTIQWMATSRVGRDVKYFTFNDENLTHEHNRSA